MGSMVLLSIIVGAVFIITGLVIALVFRKDLGPRVFWVIRVVVALGAGMLAAGILGNLTISGTWAGLSIKAGGPIAVTVLVYLVNPPKLMIAKRPEDAP